MARKKSRKINSRPKTSVAKRLEAAKKAQINKASSQPTNSIFWKKIGRYKKLFPFGIFSFIVGIYINNYPKKLEIKAESISTKNLISNILIIKNPNSFDAKKITLKINGNVDATFENSLTFSNVNYTLTDFFKTIESKKSKSINPRNMVFIGEIGEIKKIDRMSINIKYSFETPFYYPDVENDKVSISAYIKPNGDVIYVYE